MIGSWKDYICNFKFAVHENNSGLWAIDRPHVFSISEIAIAIANFDIETLPSVWNNRFAASQWQFVLKYDSGQGTSKKRI